MAADELTKRLANLSPVKRALLELRLDEKGAILPIGQTIPRRSSSEPPPLSFAQERLWFLNQLEPESPAYNESNITRLSGSLDVPALEKALNQIVERHEVLRTTIALAGGAPQQLIARSRSLDLPRIDLRTLTDKERDCEAHRLITETLRRPFDLSRDLMLRALVIRLTEQEHTFLLVKHHIASDGWSAGILWQELAALYRGSISGEMAPLPELPVQYADYAVWQRNALRGAALETKLAYWRKQLNNLPTLQLPTDRPRTPVQTLRGARHPLVLSRNLLSEINALCRRERVTMFMTLLAAFQVLLQKYSGQDDIVVGAPIAKRDRPELETLIGFFINSLVLRTDLTGNPTFRELLRRVREVALGAYEHQDVPFEKLVEQLKPERNLSHSPLFQVVFALQNAPAAPLKLEGLTATALAVDNGTAKFDLTLSLQEEAGELKGWFEYNTDLFDAATTRRMLWHFENLLRAIVANPEQPLSELPVLTHDERQQLLQEWNDTRRRYPKDSTVQGLFEAQVERTPDAVAAVFNEQQMTYTELNRDANRLGHYLQTLGVGPGTFVGVCVERSLSMIVALLGILKAGSAYVPLDPAYPKERLAFMLEDTQTPVLLTEQRLLSALPKHEMKIVCLDRDRDRIRRESEANLPGRTTAEDLAYVMYTSGSTGRPKGVEVPHRGIARLISGSEYALFGAQEVFLQLAPMSFDASTFEIWGALLHGGRCVLFPGDVPTVQELDAVLHRHSVTTLWLTASLFNAVVDQAPGALSNIRQLLTGGEALSVPHVRRAQALLPALEITNGYGPTESTTFACCYRIPKPFEVTRSSVPIGRPIANTKVYILDKHLHPVPVGVRGELHIGGDGLARGYLNETDLTAQKFIADPFNLNSGARLYKTGDLARYLPDGNIEFLGRMDRQIKLRGFRIELGEIESTLAQHPGVSETVLLAQEDNPEDKRLVAYVVPEPECCPTAAELNQFLKTKLPGYMVPSVVVFLDRLPLTANGKLDRQALSKPDLSRLGSRNSPAIPRNHVERQLANIWEKIVSVRPIGVKDNFFDLGGHSLLAIRMMSQIENVFGKKLPLNALFQAPTIEQLAALLSEEVTLAPWSSLVPLQTGGPKPPFFWVHGEASDVVLPRYLGPHQPLYGFIHQSHDGMPARQTRVEEIAAHYLSEMRSIEPKGPYYLGGYCFGGTVAFEMAQQLRREGQEVALLVLLVPSTPLNCDHFPSTVRNGSGSAVDGEPCGIEIQHHFRNQGMLEPKERIVDILAKTKRQITGTALTLSAPLRKMLKTVVCKICLKSGYPLPLSLRSFYILEIYRRALKKYVPKAYDGALVIFMSKDNPGNSKIWRKLALRGIESREVAGSHSEVLNEPYLKTWAEELKDQLDRTQSPDGRWLAQSIQNIGASNHGTFDSV